MTKKKDFDFENVGTESAIPLDVSNISNRERWNKYLAEQYGVSELHYEAVFGDWDENENEG